MVTEMPDSTNDVVNMDRTQLIVTRPQHLKPTSPASVITFFLMLMLHVEACDDDDDDDDDERMNL